MWFKKKKTQVNESNNTPRKVRLGEKLHDIMLDKQKEKEEQEKEEWKERVRVAKHEALELFECLQDEFVKVASDGETCYKLPITRLEVIMAKNNWGSNKEDLYKELKEVCKENYIKLTIVRGVYEGYWQPCLVFGWSNI